MLKNRILLNFQIKGFLCLFCVFPYLGIWKLEGKKILFIQEILYHEMEYSSITHMCESACKKSLLHDSYFQNFFT